MSQKSFQRRNKQEQHWKEESQKSGLVISEDLRFYQKYLQETIIIVGENTQEKSTAINLLWTP